MSQMDIITIYLVKFTKHIYVFVGISNKRITTRIIL